MNILRKWRACVHGYTTKMKKQKIWTTPKKSRRCCRRCCASKMQIVVGRRTWHLNLQSGSTNRESWSFCLCPNEILLQIFHFYSIFTFEFITSLLVHWEKLLVGYLKVTKVAVIHPNLATFTRQVPIFFVSNAIAYIRSQKLASIQKSRHIITFS